MKMLIAATALSMAVLPGAAGAKSGGYTANWLVTISGSAHANGNICLTLTDDGSDHYPHSGEATIPNDNYEGTFQVIDGLLVATIPGGTGTGELESFEYIGRAMNGEIGKGDYVQAYGGEVDSGVAKFAKNGC
jgi:hypothetical protein